MLRRRGAYVLGGIGALIIVASYPLVSRRVGRPRPASASLKTLSGAPLRGFFEDLPKTPRYDLKRVRLADESHRVGASCPGAQVSLWNRVARWFEPTPVYADLNCSVANCTGSYQISAQADCSCVFYNTTTTDLDPQFEFTGSQNTGGNTCKTVGCGDVCSTQTCTVYQPLCEQNGGSCSQDSDCCQQDCESGTCCLTNGNSCQSNSDCCNGNCSNGSCQASGGGGCAQDGGQCTQNSDCCNSDCNAGTCQPCINSCDARPINPIIVDLDGNGYRLTNAASGVSFDATGSGTRIRMSWTAANWNGGFLALDRNGNGRIDNGTELIGGFSPQASKPGQNANGILALAVFDQPENGGNKDGKIDSKDSIYSKLVVWVDRNHNGVSDPGELLTLEQAGIQSISLNHSQSAWTDIFGNRFQNRSQITRTGAQGGLPQWIYDAQLQQGQ
jgi:hypothetical protein